jgi:hypothetical protein
MNGRQEINEEYPYVTDPCGAEGPKHVRLKNLAIDWLLTEGYELKDITLERPYRADYERVMGVTDIYADRRGKETLFVECETWFCGARSGLSRGGAVPFRDGETVYVVTVDGVFEVVMKAVEVPYNEPFSYDLTTTVDRRGVEQLDTLPEVDES